MQPAAVPPAAAIRPAVLLNLPAAPFCKLPLAATVVITSVVVAVPFDDSGTLALPNTAFTSSEVAEEADKLTVPA
jgi:hypothetical protein